MNKKYLFKKYLITFLFTVFCVTKIIAQKNTTNLNCKNKKKHYEQIRKYEKSNNKIKLLHLLQKISKCDSIDKYEIYHKISDIYTYNNEYTKADSVLQILLSKDKNIQTLEKLGYIAYEQKKYPTASFYFKETLQLDSLDYKLYYSLGKSLLKENKLDSTYLCFKKSLKINPSLKLLEKQTALLIRKKQYTKAFFLLSNNKTSPTSAMFNKHIGICYYMLDSIPQSIQYLKKSYEMGDSSNIIIELMGKSYFIEKEYKNAIPFLNKHLKTDSLNKITQFRLAIAQTQTKKINEGETLMLNILHEMNEELLNYKQQMFSILAKTMDQNQNYKKSINYYQKLLTINHPDINKIPILFRIAQIYQHNLKNLTKALQTYQEINNQLLYTKIDTTLLDLAKNNIKRINEEIFFKGTHQNKNRESNQN